VSEHGLDLGGVGSALAEARGEGVPAAVGSQALDAGVGAGGEHDLGDAGDRKGAALPGPCGAGIAAPHVQPGRGQFPGAPGQRDEADLVALAVQADLAGAGGDREVLGSLGLVLNCVVLWTTVYLDAAVRQLRAQGYPVREEDLARLSPFVSTHLGVHGTYSFVLPDLAPGAIRDLRDPDAADDEDE